MIHRRKCEITNREEAMRGFWWKNHILTPLSAHGKGKIRFSFSCESIEARSWRHFQRKYSTFRWILLLITNSWEEAKTSSSCAKNIAASQKQQLRFFRIHFRVYELPAKPRKSSHKSSKRVFAKYFHSNVRISYPSHTNSNTQIVCLFHATLPATPPLSTSWWKRREQAHTYKSTRALYIHRTISTSHNMEKN